MPCGRFGGGGGGGGGACAPFAPPWVRHCTQKKTVAISQMFSHVQLHVHGMHLLNNRICRYTYSINTTLLRPRQVMAPHTAAMDTFC